MRGAAALSWSTRSGKACPARCCRPRAAAGVPASIRRPDPDTGAALFALLGMVVSDASGQCGPVAAEGEHGQGDQCFGGAESERDRGPAAGSWC